MKTNQVEYFIEIPPQEFLKKFEHKNIKFIVDEFEQLLLNDVYANDIETMKKLKRNVSDMFRRWIENKISKKENISISIKGQTRSGKSLLGLSVVDEVLINYDGKYFDTPKIVMGNQKEYRAKLFDADFGDVFQIDENAFANVGLGSDTEIQQLKDIQNIIAKQNIHTIYITPRTFLDVNSELGLSTWGKDSANWLSRVLVYKTSNKVFPLLGYMVIDVGKLFRKYSCYIYKELGGCTNPNKIKDINELDKDTLKYSCCILKNYDKEKLHTKGQVCPFYEVCKHPLNQYEKKKDSWIAKEMKGGLDERTAGRFETAIKLLPKLTKYDLEKQALLVTSRDGKQLGIKIGLYIGSVSSTKYTKTELEEIKVTLLSLTDFNFFAETLYQLEDDGFNKDYEKVLLEIENGQDLIERYKLFKEMKQQEKAQELDENQE